jgi:hypothetical protein
VASPDDLTNAFAEDYFSARQRFLERVRDAAWSVASHQITATGPAGEPLFIDVAVRDGSGAAKDRTLIVSSGLHGVEGFLGSAVQCAALDWLAAHPSPLPRRGGEGTGNWPRLVFIHALNPFGFAWIRRCNEDNVDLNRNFPAPGNTYRGSPDDYAQLNWLLNKKSPPSRWEPFRLLSLAAILRYGIPRLKRAIAAGQYDYPQGLFYGGAGPCETTRFVQSQFAGWLGNESGDVLHLDFHTGLGASGEFQLLADVPPTPEQAARIRRLFNREVLAGPQSPVVAYQARGSISEWCQIVAEERDYQYLCVEFGTHSPAKVLTALRAENRAQHWDRPGTPSYRWAKDLLKEAFCPRSLAWRQRAAEQGLDLIVHFFLQRD